MIYELLLERQLQQTRRFWIAGKESPSLVQSQQALMFVLWVQVHPHEVPSSLLLVHQHQQHQRHQQLHTWFCSASS